jgi:DNA modification methylase
VTSRILVGDALVQLRTLPDESVQCCVTSPPYWGLRDYGTASWNGGEPECQHRIGGQVPNTIGQSNAIVGGVQRIDNDAPLFVETDVAAPAAPGGFPQEELPLLNGAGAEG